MGLKSAGFDVVGAVEIDDLAARTYRLNHPAVRMWHEDIRNVRGVVVRRELGLKKGELDLLAGCPPCQGFSRLRTLNGRSARDPRNDLVFEFLRFVDELRPKAVLMENVPGLARDRRLTQFIEGLNALGYHCNHDVLDAARYAVPQRRARLIVLCGRRDSIPFSPEARVKRTVRDAIKGLPRAGRSGDPAHDVVEQRSARISDMIRHVPKNGGSRKDLPTAYRLECHARCDGFYDVYGRMRWDDVAPTITSGFVNPSKGRFLHPHANRTITVREAALLQTFPRDYLFPMEAGKYPVAAMIGNAIPPEFIRRQALRVRRYLLSSAR
ncbi:MAG: DNA cytosine methyltransferase [Labilithrix sp.]|nr:DNA cytosine methyltransferase [Labilithrix sp.]